MVIAPHSARADSLFAPRLRAMTVGSVALVSMLAFEALAVGTAMPTVARALDGLALYGIAFGGPFAAGVVAMVLSGIWCDLRGPRAPMWSGLAGFVVGLLLAGAATAMGMLVVGRIVQGFGSGLLSVALYVIVAQAYPERLHRRIFAAFAAAWVVPSLVGPVVAGLVVEHFGWRWVFLAVPVVAVPAVLLVHPGLRVVRAPGAAVSPAGAGARIGWACGAGVSAALLHIGGQQRGLAAVLPVGLALVGLLVCAARLLPTGFLRAARGLPTVVGLRGLASGAFVGAEVVIPLMLSRERGFSPTAAGLVLTTGALAWSLGSWAQGRIRTPPSQGTLPRAGLACITVGTAVVGTSVVPAVPVWAGVLGWAVAGLGMGLLYPSLSALTLELSVPGEQGRNSSSLQLSDSLAAATVLALTGAVLAVGAAPGRVSYAVTLVVAAGLALVGALLAGRVVPGERR
ncbi:Major Facilitator Superfamily protein [Micromonospora phaseoli]|uniref:Major Facilitator Superfamily protein n=1 Tax=Micromonospora phaseoli TaxID=1144548 RepID=A0A1H7BC37_9ACTN|nr:MFS transporter [Micromonospora phaseoli]PZV95047.1 MFS transporter [Micromonospora phaseoli]GIJ79528.1 MFS transporter [Micromonospora phaseoli]SEJ75249.1 Major Facilitator Superfamily protein [Micromonospora phaseoli]